MNNIGEIINIRQILEKHKGEPSCATQAKICEYLDCHNGEVYVVFDDKDNIQNGILCKIREDTCANFTLAAFDKNENNESLYGEYWINRGSNGNAIVYLDHYNYMIRLN